MSKNYDNLENWIAMLEKKPDVNDVLNQLISEPETIPILLEIISFNKGSVKFYCEKILQMLSEKKPDLVYPYFDDIVMLMDSRNNIIKWGAIVILSNLISEDTENKFKEIYEKYFGLINSDSMITAGNVVGNAWKFILARPEYENDITKRLLSVTDNVYLNKGEPSPECKNIMYGHVLDCFDKYYTLSAGKKKMIDFAAGQRNNSRKSVASKAEAFLKKHVDTDWGQVL